MAISYHSVNWNTQNKVDSVLDPDGLLINLIAGTTCRQTCFRMIDFIDPYGDTIFNQLQIVPVISELIDLRRDASNREIEIIDKVQAIAKQCKEGDVLYFLAEGD